VISNTLEVAMLMAGAALGKETATPARARGAVAVGGVER